MSEYFVWTTNAGVSNATAQPIWSLDLDPKSVPYWELQIGKPITNWDSGEVALCNSVTNPTDYPFTSYGIPVVSARLRAFVEKEAGSTSIQYLPIRIQERLGLSVFDGYSVANILNVVDCLDRTRSRFELWTKDNLAFWEKRAWMLGTFRSVRVAHFDLTTVGNYKLFRMWGYNWIVVREDLKQAIEDAGMTGVGFREPEFDPVPMN